MRSQSDNCEPNFACLGIGHVYNMKNRISFSSLVYSLPASLHP